MPLTAANSLVNPTQNQIAIKLTPIFPLVQRFTIAHQRKGGRWIIEQDGSIRHGKDTIDTISKEIHDWCDSHQTEIGTMQKYQVQAHGRPPSAMLDGGRLKPAIEGEEEYSFQPFVFRIGSGDEENDDTLAKATGTFAKNQVEVHDRSTTILLNQLARMDAFNDKLHQRATELATDALKGTEIQLEALRIQLEDARQKRQETRDDEQSQRDAEKFSYMMSTLKDVMQQGLAVWAFTRANPEAAAEAVGVDPSVKPGTNWSGSGADRAPHEPTTSAHGHDLAVWMSKLSDEQRAACKEALGEDAWDLIEAATRADSNDAAAAILSNLKDRWEKQQKKNPARFVAMLDRVRTALGDAAPELIMILLKLGVIAKPSPKTE